MHRIFLIGYMGAGKTTIGKALARALNISFVDLDLYIEQRYHKSVSALFAEKGEQEFRNIERMMLHEVAAFENVIISTGGGTPVFFDNMDFMKLHGCTIYLQAAVDVLTERLYKNSDKRPLLAGKSKSEIHDFIQQTLSAREQYYLQSRLTVKIEHSQEKAHTTFEKIMDSYNKNEVNVS